MGRLKKTLLKTHQITGTILSLMFVVWFASGIVLIFERFPHASRQERFLHLETFTCSDFTTMKSLPDSIKGSGISIEKYQGKPVYRIPTGRHDEIILDAQSLIQIQEFSENKCLEMAESYTGYSPKKTVKIVKLDPWLPWSYYAPLLPIYKYYLNDPEHSIVYVSSKTGNIVQITTRKKRWLARIGAIPHWMYFTSLRTKTALWEHVIIWLALLGIIVSLTGIIAGIIRLNKKRKKGLSPYKKFWFKWHHLFGFFFGLFVFTFVLSGLFSVIDLPQWIAPVNKQFNPKKLWNKPTKEIANSIYKPLQLWNVLENKAGVRKIEMNEGMGQALWLVYYNKHKKPEVYTLLPDTIIKKSPYSLKDIKNKAQQIYPDMNYNIFVQDSYDNYYKKSAMKNYPLPAYSIKWDNNSKDILYIDPLTGQALTSNNRNSRIHRWLYQGLHKMEFKFLKQHEVLRKTILILLSIGGLIISFTGVILGCKWLKRILKKHF